MIGVNSLEISRDWRSEHAFGHSDVVSASSKIRGSSLVMPNRISCPTILL